MGNMEGDRVEIPGEKQESVLRRGDLIVSPVTTEYHLSLAYIRMVEEGTLSTVFHQGVPTMRAFLEEYMTAGRRVTLSCFREEGGRMEFCGLGWVYGAVTMDRFKKAETGVVFFRRQSRKTDNLEFGKMMFEVFFTRYEIDAIFGTTPEPNILALRYAQKLGMDLVGPIPNFCTWNGNLADGWISHMSRTQWLERNS